MERILYDEWKESFYLTRHYRWILMGENPLQLMRIFDLSNQEGLVNQNEQSKGILDSAQKNQFIAHKRTRPKEVFSPTTYDLADGEGFEPPVFNSILRFSRPTLSTAQTSIPFALRPPCTLAGSSLCDSLRLLAPPIGGLYCLTERERVVVRIATLRVYIYIYDNMHLLLSFMPYRTESSFSQDHFTRPQPLKRAIRTYSLGGSIPL